MNRLCKVFSNPNYLIFDHLHHFLLGVIEALCDEVQGLLLRDGILGHPCLLRLEGHQLGLA